MENKESLWITAKEYDALNDIRGLKEKAHFMVICAKQTNSGGYILEGTSAAFDELTSGLSDELFYELSPPGRLKQLGKLYSRLFPEGDF